uniref:Uncharacterized protein n=1 Tax=Anguilla anguilla TaxID=7936 RepID=A0A0E9TVC2_ANGAN
MTRLFSKEKKRCFSEFNDFLLLCHCLLRIANLLFFPCIRFA